MVGIDNAKEGITTLEEILQVTAEDHQRCMGLLDNLFKPKPDSDGEKIVEISGNPEPGELHTPSAHAADAPAAKASPFLAPKHYVPRSSVQIVPPSRSQLQVERKVEPVRNAPAMAKEIVLTLGDVLSQIPTHFLRPGMHDVRRELRFAADGLAADIARGRAGVHLAEIVAQCPDIFLPEANAFDDTQIRLPLQKLVEQIGLAPMSRSASPEPPPQRPAGGMPAGQTTPTPIPESLLVKSPLDFPGSRPSPPPQIETASESPGEEQIHLSLAAILKRCPREIIVQPLPPIDESVRISFPFPPIERQLATGQVEVSSLRFIAALPLGLMRCFEAKAGVKVPLPLEEIFQNLPEQTPPPGVGMRFHAPRPEPDSSAESRELSSQNAKLAEAILLEPMPGPIEENPAVAQGDVFPNEPPATVPVEHIVVAANFSTESVVEPVAQPAVEAIGPDFHTPPVIPPPEICAVEIPAEPKKVETTERSGPETETPVFEEPAMDAALFEQTRVTPEPPVEAVAASVPPILREPPELPVPAAAFHRFVPSLPPPVLLKPNAEFGVAQNAPVVPSQPEPPSPPASLDIPAKASAVSAPEIPESPQAFEPAPEAIPPASVLTPPLPEPAPVEPEPVTAILHSVLPDVPAKNLRIAPPQFRPVVVLPPPIVIGTADVAAPLSPPADPVPQPGTHAAAVNQEPEPFAEMPPVESEPSVIAEIPVATPTPTRKPPVSVATLLLDGNVRALFASDEPLPLPRVGQLLAALPGIQGCVLTARDTDARGGELPAGLDASAVRELGLRMHGALSDRTETFSPGHVQHFTLHAESYSLTLFVRGEACVCAVHRARIFLPGVREKFAAVADELSGVGH